jgi:hypothetical protein
MASVAGGVSMKTRWLSWKTRGHRYLSDCLMAVVAVLLQTLLKLYRYTCIHLNPFVLEQKNNTSYKDVTARLVLKKMNIVKGATKCGIVGRLLLPIVV